MLAILNIPAKLVGLLESNVSPSEIAAGVCLGVFMGFIPMNGPMALLLILFFLLFKLNRVSTAIVLPFLKLFYLLGVSNLTDWLGGVLLIKADFLAPFWSCVTNLPVLVYLDINNTLVAGGLLFSVIVSLPVYFITMNFAARAKVNYDSKYKGMKVVQLVKKIPIVGWIVSLGDKFRDRSE